MIRLSNDEKYNGSFKVHQQTCTKLAQWQPWAKADFFYVFLEFLTKPLLPKLCTALTESWKQYREVELRIVSSNAHFPFIHLQDFRGPPS